MEAMVFKHFWIAFIAVTLINGIPLIFNSKKYIKEHNELQTGYKKMFLFYITIGNLPWIIMGLGMIFGYTETVFDFFRPRDLNPIVLIFHASLLSIMVLFCYWVFFRNGAEFLEKHKGLLVKRSNFRINEKLSTKQIKLYIGLMLMGGLIGMAMMWIIDIPKL